jgi:cellulose synthase/poly-beta-1,6-N-acetylglucosamine synthase-like glycosyltransferase
VSATPAISFMSGSASSAPAYDRVSTTLPAAASNSGGIARTLYLSSTGVAELYSGSVSGGPRCAVSVFADAGAVDRASLLREASSLCSVLHPCVVRVLAVELDDSADGCHLVVARDWAPVSLRQAVSQDEDGRSLPLPTRIIALLSAALGIAALHEHPDGPFVAGDVRGSTLSYGNDGSAMVNNWGFARIVRAIERGGGANNSRNSGSRALWRAPELFTRRGDGSTLSASTDVYSFAVTAWEILTGATPYDEVDDIDPEGLIARITCASEPLRPSMDMLPSSTPLDLRVMIEAAWAHDAASRPSMRDFVRVLTSAAEYLNAMVRANKLLTADREAYDVAARKAGRVIPASNKHKSSRVESKAIVLVDDDDLPSSASMAGSAFTAQSVPIQSRAPRVVLQPFWSPDPPAWEPDFSTPSAAASARYSIPPELAAALLPLPERDAAACVAACVVPFYTEGGFALRRTLEALALQAADLRTASAETGESPPVIHVFGIADGWSKADGSPIFSKSAFAEILEIFGQTLDVDGLVDMLEGSREDDDDVESGSTARGPLPDAVFVQFAAPVAANNQQRSRMELRPLPLDCVWALGMNARASAPRGVITNKLRSRRVRVSGQKTMGVRSGLLSGTGPRAPIEMHDDTQPIYFTLMIKRKNAKKHHSLRWFFEALGPVTRARGGPRFEWMFATDCGTLYAPFCLAELIAHLASHPSCAAVTAHQRIMERTDQVDPSEADQASTFAAQYLRSVQGFDFESGLCVFNGMHGLAGFLPVVPGPCGLFRANAITNGILTSVRTICHSTPEDGLVLSNLLLAEDRILSYLLVLVTQPQREGELFARTWQTHWVPSTTFFFESEATLKEFVLQRRRWLNGTVMGYIWLFFQEPLWAGVVAFRATAWAVFLLSAMQLAVFGLVFIMPGMLILSGTLAISGLVLITNLAGVPYSSLSSIIIYGYILVASVTFVTHVVYARAGPSNFTEAIWNTRIVFNALTMATIAFVTVTVGAIACVRPAILIGAISADGRIDQSTATSSVNLVRVAGMMGFLYTATPFFLASMHSRESFINMVTWFPRFFLFQPTILADFFAYSCARFDDLSWGTKAVASTGQTLAGGAAKKAADRADARRSARAANGSERPVGNRRAHIAEKLRISASREASNSWATTVSIVQVVLCLTIAVVNYAINQAFTRYLFYLGAGLSSIGFGIMSASFVYFASSACCGRNATLSSQANATLVVGTWLTLIISVILVSAGLYQAGGSLFAVALAIFVAAQSRHFFVNSEANSVA